MQRCSIANRRTKPRQTQNASERPLAQVRLSCLHPPSTTARKPWMPHHFPTTAPPPNAKEQRAPTAGRACHPFPPTLPDYPRSKTKANTYVKRSWGSVPLTLSPPPAATRLPYFTQYFMFFFTKTCVDFGVTCHSASSTPISCASSLTMVDLADPGGPTSASRRQAPSLPGRAPRASVIQCRTSSTLGLG